MDNYEFSLFAVIRDLGKCVLNHTRFSCYLNIQWQECVLQIWYREFPRDLDLPDIGSE